MTTGSLPGLGFLRGSYDDGAASTSGLSHLGRTTSISIEGDDKIKGSDPRWQPQERPGDERDGTYRLKDRPHQPGFGADNENSSGLSPLTDRSTYVVKISRVATDARAGAGQVTQHLLGEWIKRRVEA
ncbi:hypothetical protein HMPREF9622_02134 [Cutibacterium modestum HL037PA3]|uniref:Uncharacterized protein n=1 Tax=Cutibacterium modestum HL044PA1 TaxID=765109 RepID=A0ABP2K5B3_9ACTN|nr:hypothetical protein HMPREF9621_02030 [Cutibacterium modestum HL037PA2]EFS90975.1 hypothetical protein HMPREF9607_02814 [Cutibacterium modestum HL044PA1]EFT14773.1 hypothetical protein HMPREF9622_02134 [Cutibacterium modestum HL037PA3]